MHKIFNYEDPSLTQTIKGITFNNPIGLAAGFDKSCEVPKALENVLHQNLKMATETTHVSSS